MVEEAGKKESIRSTLDPKPISGFPPGFSPASVCSYRSSQSGLVKVAIGSGLAVDNESPLMRWTAATASPLDR